MCSSSSSRVLIKRVSRYCHCANTDADCPLSATRTQLDVQKSSNCEIIVVHSGDALVDTSEDFRRANRRNIPEDQYPESRQYLQYPVVLVCPVHRAYRKSIAFWKA